ncbi:MAG: AAA family ATPase, partial [Candidatus Absconditicoccaceae bacterium]
YYKEHYIVQYQENDYTRHVLSDYSDQYKSFMKSIFSDVSINFTANVRNSTDKKLDTEVLSSIKSSENIAQDITQTLVDIKIADNADLADWVALNQDMIPPAEEKDKRTRRFKESFDKMFADTRLVYKNVRDLKPIFEKNDQEIEINHLSSGEKQIVFRGGFLLKDKQSISGALVLVDEPEISMHPCWQKKALDFYKNLFRDGSGNQTSQLIVTTHSPYVLQTYDSNTDCIVVFSPAGAKRIGSMRAYIGSIPSLGVINRYAFNLPTVEFFDELYEYIQKESGCNTQKFLEKYLKNRGIEQDKEYMDYGKIKHCTLRTFIRNKIHHLGVYQGGYYSNDEFIFAIKGMIDFISKRRLGLPQFPLAILPCSLYSN